MAKIKKGDKVVVISGRDKNKTGEVERVLTKTGQLIVTGVNTVKKHVKVSKKFPAGGVVEVAKPMPEGKVALVCPSCGKATRVGYNVLKTGKVRVCKKCKKELTQKKEKGDK